MQAVTMTTPEWIAFQGNQLEDRYQLASLVRSFADQAVYRATDQHSGEVVFVTLWSKSPDQNDLIRKRYLEASYLSHPNLLKVHTAGNLQADQALTYAVTEPFEWSVADRQSQPGFGLADVHELFRQVVSGLMYLHFENLVYCAELEPSIGYQAGLWKLADFSELRLEGTRLSREQNNYVARAFSVPPEVHDGIVSTAWDSWSIGMLRDLVQKTLVRQTGDGLAHDRRELARQLRSVDLPAPFSEIVRCCTIPDPQTRMKLPAVQALLEAPPDQQAAPAKAIEPERVQARPEEPIPIPLGLRPLPPRMPSILRPQPRAKTGIATPLKALGLAVLLVPAIGIAISYFQEKSTPSHIIEFGGDAPQPQAKALPPITVEGNADRAVADPPVNIQTLLHQWETAIRRGDLNRQMSLYGPVIYSYYGQRNVTAAQLVRMKQAWQQKTGAINMFDVNDVHVDHIDSRAATVSFDKTWDFGTRSHFTGSERAQLQLENQRGRWRIVGEKELRVYRVKHAT